MLNLNVSKESQAIALNLTVWTAAAVGITTAHRNKKTAVLCTVVTVWAWYSARNVQAAIDRIAKEDAEIFEKEMIRAKWEESIYFKTNIPSALSNEPTPGEIRALEVLEILRADPTATVKENWSELHLGMNHNDARQNYVVWDRQFALSDDLFAVMHPELV